MLDNAHFNRPIDFTALSKKRKAGADTAAPKAKKAKGRTWDSRCDFGGRRISESLGELLLESNKGVGDLTVIVDYVDQDLERLARLVDVYTFCDDEASRHGELELRPKRP